MSPWRGRDCAAAFGSSSRYSSTRASTSADTPTSELDWLSSVVSWRSSLM